MAFKTKCQAEGLQQRSRGLQSLKYVLFGPGLGTGHLATSGLKNLTGSHAIHWLLNLQLYPDALPSSRVVFVTLFRHLHIPIFYCAQAQTSLYSVTCLTYGITTTHSVNQSVTWEPALDLPLPQLHMEPPWSLQYSDKSGPFRPPLLPHSLCLLPGPE